MAIVILCILGLLVGQTLAIATYEEKELYLLNVIPTRDSSPGADWDYGMEISPGAHLAEDEINNHSDVLPGYSLKVIDVGSEACGYTVIVSGLVNLYGHLIDRDLPIVGVTGMLCSSVTNSLVPFLDHPQINYLTLAGSTSPQHRNIEKYPLLFHILTSSQIFNEAVLQLMEEFKWSQIALVYDSELPYYLNTGLDFIEKIRNRNGMDFTTTVPIDQRTTEQDILDPLVRGRARIVFASVSHFEAAKLLCGAYKLGLSYPAYFFIIHEDTVENIIALASYTTCTDEEMRKGTEGHLYLFYRLRQIDSDKVLISGKTYSDFQREYRHRVTSLELEENEYAAVQYDQVWAFALALNLSLEALETSRSSRSFGNQHITDTLLNNLANVSFEGAIGTIRFGEKRETRNAVKIFQGINGTMMSIGTYLPYEKTVSYNEEGEYLLQTVPRDRFDSVYSNKIPLWLGVSILALCGLSIIFTTINLIVFLYWRRQPAIKATSPWLSVFIFIGCYLLSSAAAAQTIQLSLFHGSLERLFIAVCYTDIWLGSLGFLLIFGTLFVRLLRIYWIFSGTIRRMNRLWSNPVLFLGVLTICLLDAIVLSIWALVDPIQQNVSLSYVLAQPLSYYELFATCSSQFLPMCYATTYLYCGIVMLSVMFLAIQTRHIRYQNFKDTKKLIAFASSVMFIFSVCITLWNVFGIIRAPIVSHLIFSMAHLSAATLCQVLIITPKITPLLFKRS